ncbi:MAG: phosphomannomutase [Clostridia bacterium]|nr:phosphomannomutase [Clostridia bacterium]
MKKLIGFDLDGTLSQHKSPMDLASRSVLDDLRAGGWDLVMVCAGQCGRVYSQMGGYPVDILGNYGMQRTTVDGSGNLVTVWDKSAPCDRESVSSRIAALRDRFGLDSFTGDGVEFHPSGCVTFPILGTGAELADKLRFDPDRVKRRKMLPDVIKAFPEYTVFVGGTSSFDMAPRPYDKWYALKIYMQEKGIGQDDIVFAGDDWGPGGNDESVYRSGAKFICIDDYRRLRQILTAEKILN